MKVAVVIPSYKVEKHILTVLSRIGHEVHKIYVIDDHCPNSSGKLVESKCLDPRVQVIYLHENIGVGGATLTGFLQALDDGMEIVVKLDGDGQMDPSLIPDLIYPITTGVADFTKGNRFYNIEFLSSMPLVRLIGNSFLSFVNKAVSGYWNLMDPTNGYLAIHASVFKLLPFKKIEKRYFFESDLLFRLGTIRAVVHEVPMESVYSDEKSNLSILKVMLTFPGKYLSRFAKRIIYSYLLRDFNLSTIQFCLGLVLFLFGVIFGGIQWYSSILHNRFASVGTVMIAALPIILGFQLLISALSFDVSNIPTVPLQQRFRKNKI